MKNQQWCPEEKYLYIFGKGLLEAVFGEAQCKKTLCVYIVKSFSLLRVFEQRVDEGEEKRRARSLPFLEITITATGTETNDRATINKEPSLHCVNNNYPGPAEEGTLYK